MQAFVASLTAAMLFIHTVCGCCWHHAHQGEHGANVVQAVRCRHHQHASDPSSSHEAPENGKPDCEGTCSYVVPQKVVIDPPQWVAVGLASVLPALTDFQAETASFWQAALLPVDLVPPLRTHLLHQVLLN